MTGQPKSGGGRREKRQSRLADKLRQNLVKRKAKVRAVRAATDPDETGRHRTMPPRDSGEESTS